jgi:hypothetical protein
MATRTKIRRPLTVVDRKTAAVAEESFFERLGANMNVTMGVYNPLDNRTYDASPRNRVMKQIDERSSEVKALIKKHAERDLMKTYEEMPKNTVHTYEVLHKELLGPKTVRVVIAGASFSPIEELVKKGESSKLIGPEELLRTKELIAVNPNAFYYIGAFATTGWDEGAKAALVGPNFLIALCDVCEDAWRTWFAPDARWRGAARVFDMTTEEEKIEAVQRFVKKHTAKLLMDEMTEDFVFDELGYSIPIIREAFEAISEQDSFIKFDTSTRPFRLIRNYG